MAETQATVESSVDWLMAHLHELARHDAWPQFASEVREIVSQLENVLQAGNRSVRGVPCLSIDCTGELVARYIEPKPCTHDTEARRNARRLIRWNATMRTLGYPEAMVVGWRIVADLRLARLPCEQTGCDQGGRRDQYKCSGCGRTYDAEQAAKAETHWDMQRAPYGTVTQISNDLGKPRNTVKSWVHRGLLVGKRSPRGWLFDRQEARQLAMRGDVA